MVPIGGERGWILAIAGVWLAACSFSGSPAPSGRTPPTDPNGLSGTNAQPRGQVPGGTVPGGSAGSGGLGAGSGGSGLSVGDLEGCTGTSVTAPPSSQPKVDLIWVVDASGSMLDEQMKIGANITQFANDITGASLDVHIVMMSTSAAVPVICPPYPGDPAANTALAGDPRYLFIDASVDSHNALDIAISSFGQYQRFLRPDAVAHFVFVTDDESTYSALATPGERASAFAADMQALLGKDFIAHTVSSEGPTACADPMCMPDPNSGLCVFVMLGCGAAAPGTTYWELAASTAGLTSSICQQDWSGVFGPLTDAVIASAPLPCNYVIPPPPAGQSLDANKVNVGWLAPGAAAEEIFGKTVNSSACGPDLAWYYDTEASPREVLLCPATCRRVAAGGTINIAFG